MKYNYDYYEVLGVEKNTEKDEIKKNYHKLSKKYHPDKNKRGEEEFKKINEAYHHLSDDHLRKKYDFETSFFFKNIDFFKNVDLNNEELDIIYSYYEKITESKEFILMKLIYNSFPPKVKDHIKMKINEKLKKENNISYGLIKKEKSIDINELNENLIINLNISYSDYINKKLKIFHVYSKCGNYYFYLREFNNKKFLIYNLNCYLTININIK